MQFSYSTHVEEYQNSYFLKCNWSGWYCKEAYTLPSYDNEGKYKDKREGCFLNPACAVAWLLNKRNNMIELEKTKCEPTDKNSLAYKRFKPLNARIEDIMTKFTRKLNHIAVDIGIAEFIKYEEEELQNTNTKDEKDLCSKSTVVYRIEYKCSDIHLVPSPAFGPLDKIPTIPEHMLGTKNNYVDAEYIKNSKNNTKRALPKSNLSPTTTATAKLKPLYIFYVFEQNKEYAKEIVITKNMNEEENTILVDIIPLQTKYNTMQLLTFHNNKIILLTDVQDESKLKDPSNILRVNDVANESYLTTITGIKAEKGLLISTEIIKEIRTKEQFDKDMAEAERKIKEKFKRRRVYTGSNNMGISITNIQK